MICFLLSIFLLVNVTAVVSTCCEKTKVNTAGTGGAYCQQIDDASLCATGKSNVPTSCEATSYCQTGTCIDNEGTCTPSSRTACDDNHGQYADGNGGAQCQSGCCVLGEETALVPLTKCERFSSDRGLNTDFRATIQTITECNALSSPSVKGACTFTNDNSQKDCTMGTKKQCQDKKAANPSAEFHQGYLCSAADLGTICGPRGGTVCDDVTGKVLFKDTCNQPANVYDFSKLNDVNYWTLIQNPDPATCTLGAKDSATCGNCDYNLGSTCKPVRTGESVSAGNNICRSLDCKGYVGQGFTGTATDSPKHGEAWCAQSDGSRAGIFEKGGVIGGVNAAGAITGAGGNSAPGNQYYELMCYNGEVTTKNCDTGTDGGARAKVCVESNLGTTAAPFRNAFCKTNVWMPCAGINNSADCEDRQAGDCQWKENGFYLSSAGLGNKTETDASKANTAIPNGICVPLWAPGFVKNSGDTTQNGADTCKPSTSQCTVTYRFSAGDTISNWWENIWSGGKKGFMDKLKRGELTREEKYNFCIKSNSGISGGYNCQCLLYEGTDTSWSNTMNGICTSLGDCGVKTNILGKTGASVKIIDIKPLEEGSK